MSDENRKIKDFGEKIGRARKDLWLQRGGLSTSDLLDLNEREIKQYVTKKNVWPKFDYERMYEGGESSLKQIYFVKKIYDSIPTRPANNTHAETENYIESLNKMREFCNEVLQLEPKQFLKELDDRTLFDKFCDKTEIMKTVNTNGYERRKWNYASPVSQYVPTKLINNLRDSEANLMKEIVTKNFLASRSELLRMTTSIIPTGTELVKIEPNYSGKTRIEITNPSHTSTIYLYPEDADKVQKGDFILYNPYAHYDVALAPFFKECHPCKSLDEALKEIEAMGKSLDVAEEVFEKIEQMAKEQQKEKRKEEKKKDTKTIVAETEVYREGPKILEENAEVKGEDYKDVFKFKGGEFGNWLKDNERQKALNTAYEAFHDLAYALGINPEDISLNETLSIAFGSRGVGGKKAPAAHYEYNRKVINLTKMSGAGCLAHEFGHALDDYLSNSGMVKEVSDIKDALQRKEIITQPDREKADKMIAEEANFLLSYIKYHTSSNYGRTPFSEAEEKQIKDHFINLLTDARDNYNSELFHDYMNLFNGKVKTTEIYEKRLGGIKDLLTQHDIKIGKQNMMDICNSMYSSVDSSHEVKYGGKVKYEKTEYLKHSIEYGKVAGKLDYYQDSDEMFARAFHQYVDDILTGEGIKSIFLTDMTKSGPVPAGEEKEQFAKMFDDLIAEAQERGLLGKCEDLEHFYQNAYNRINNQNIIQQEQTPAMEAPVL